MRSGRIRTLQEADTTGSGTKRERDATEWRCITQPNEPQNGDAGAFIAERAHGRTGVSNGDTDEERDVAKGIAEWS